MLPLSLRYSSYLPSRQDLRELLCARSGLCSVHLSSCRAQKVLPQLDSQGRATCQDPIHAPGHLMTSTWLAVVCARWLEQPSPWLWPRAEVTAGQTELDREGILSRFGPHCGPPGRLHWVRPGLLAAALITCQGSLEVCQHSGPCLKLLSASACITVLRIGGVAIKSAAAARRRKGNLPVTPPLHAASLERLERPWAVLLAHNILAAAAQRQLALCGCLRREGACSESHCSHRRGPQHYAHHRHLRGPHHWYISLTIDRLGCLPATGCRVTMPTCLDLRGVNLREYTRKHQIALKCCLQPELHRWCRCASGLAGCIATCAGNASEHRADLGLSPAQQRCVRWFPAIIPQCLSWPALSSEVQS